MAVMTPENRKSRYLIGRLREVWPETMPPNVRGYLAGFGAAESRNDLRRMLHHLRQINGALPIPPRSVGVSPRQMNLNPRAISGASGSPK